MNSIETTTTAAQGTRAGQRALSEAQQSTAIIHPGFQDGQHQSNLIEAFEDNIVLDYPEIPASAALVAGTMSAFGHIDILVCNAASNPYYGPLSGIQDEQFRKVLDNNILANHWPVQLVSPLMIEPARRSMIIISSIGGLHRSAVLGNPQTLDRKLAMTPLKLRSHAARVNASRLASGPHFVEYDVPTPDSRPGGMVIGPDGNVWFIESIGNILGRIYADDQITEFPIPTPNANLTRATTA